MPRLWKYGGQVTPLSSFVSSTIIAGPENYSPQKTMSGKCISENEELTR